VGGDAGRTFRRSETRLSSGSTSGKMRPDPFLYSQVELRPPSKNMRFRFVCFVVHEHLIPSVVIQVHLWLKKHPTRARFAAQLELRPPSKNMRFRFVCFVVHEHPISSVVIHVYPWLKKTSNASQVCGSGGTSPSLRCVSFREKRPDPFFVLQKQVSLLMRFSGRIRGTDPRKERPCSRLPSRNLPKPRCTGG
jgi:hypothetical protein